MANAPQRELDRVVATEQNANIKHKLEVLLISMLYFTIKILDSYKRIGLG